MSQDSRLGVKRSYRLSKYVLELGNVIPSEGQQEGANVWIGKDCEGHNGDFNQSNSRTDAV